MAAFIVRRLVQSIIVMLAVAFVSFSLFTYVGDPINNMVGQETTMEQREELRERLGLNDPFPVQFARFIGNAIQGEFGISYRMARPVEQIIAERLPATLELAFVSAVFALVVGIALGIYTALGRESVAGRLVLSAAFVATAALFSWIGAAIVAAVMLAVTFLYRGKWVGSTIMSLSLIGVSLPTFLIGILLIYVFAVELGWLPSFGRGEVVSIGGWTTGFLTPSGLQALILPGITLGLFQLTLIMRLVRSEMLEVLRTDYIKFARARGLTNRAINFGHALKNTLVPVITITGLQLGSIIAFAIITETVFQWPGVGLLFIIAVQFVDIPVMSAYLMMIAFVFVVINLVVDLLYYAVDPRLRVERAGGGGH